MARIEPLRNAQKRSFRSLMSIARRDAKSAKVLKDLNFFASGVRFVIIKVLKDLESGVRSVFL